MAIKVPARPKKATSASPTVPPESEPPVQDDPPEDLLTILEARAFAKVSDSTMRRWIRSRQLRCYRVGRQIRIDRKDLIKFILKLSRR